MSIFNEYPYTNFHEMNLDWIIKEIKNYIMIGMNLQSLIESVFMDNGI